MVSAEEADEIDKALDPWRQGDITLDAGLALVHLADLSRPLSPVAEQALNDSGQEAPSLASEPTPIADEGVRGLVVLTQTCDIVRKCTDRPFIEVAPLVQVSSARLRMIRDLKMPSFAYIPATAEQMLVADLDRSMTVEKSVAAKWTRVAGWQTDEEGRDFAVALGRKRTRFSFPDDFQKAINTMQKRLLDKHNRLSAEGAHLRALREIRVRAAPSWDTASVKLSFWFIKKTEPDGFDPAWPNVIESWIELFDQTGRFQIELALPCRLEDITARDYVESEHLDLDQLSAPRPASVKTGNSL
jgi:hypothetical protein